MPAHYDLEELVQACAGKTDRGVYIVSKALRTAEADFSLRGKGRVKEFIANGGLERPFHIHKKPLEQLKGFNFSKKKGGHDGSEN
jgi:hypothetical protein